MELGKFEITRITYSPKDIIDDVIDLFTPNAQNKDIQLIKKIDPSMPTKIVGDEVRMKQILNNIVSNAIKFTESG